MTIESLGAVPAGKLERGFAADSTAAGAARAPAAATTAAPLKPAATPEPESQPAGTMDELKEAVTRLNESVHAQNLEFSIDEDSKRTIVKVIDSATGEVVRQLPTKDALEIAKSLDKAFGLLIRQQA